MSRRRSELRLALPWWLWPAWIVALGVAGWDLGSDAGALAADAGITAALVAIAWAWGRRGGGDAA